MDVSGLRGRSFSKLLDFSAGQVVGLLELARLIKAGNCSRKQLLKGKNIALIFEKDSTRTRCAFEVAAARQGAHTTYIGPSGSQFGKKESVKDTARVLGRIYDGIGYRGYGQGVVDTLARYSGVPVWNGLTTEFHPTQVLADLLTMSEHSGKGWNEIKFCFIGDARNNVSNSLMEGAALLGMDFRAVCPRECSPEKWMREVCRETAEHSGARISVTRDIEKGVKDCDFIYTDVWVSMGEPEEIWAEKIKLLEPYRVSARVMRAAGNPGVKFMHCLPAFHDQETETGRWVKERFGIAEMEVTDEVFESPASIVFDQAENRLCTIEALMISTLNGGCEN